MSTRTYSRRRKQPSQVIDSDDEEVEIFESQPRKRRRGGSQISSSQSSSQRNFTQDDDDEYVEESQQKSQSISTEEKEQLVASLVRLALFKDSKKLPLRRDEINELVFTKKHSKKRGLFQEVLDEATTILKDVFGFDLVELPKITSQKDGKKKPSQMPSNQWILRLAEGESKELLEKRCTELQRDCDIPMMGLLMVILSLIQSNNEILEEAQLWTYLKRLDIEKGIIHPVFGNPEKVIDRFLKELYLTKIKDKSDDGSGFIVKFKAGPRITKEMNNKDVVLNYLSQITGTVIDNATLKEFRGLQDENEQDTENPKENEQENTRDERGDD